MSRQYSRRDFLIKSLYAAGGVLVGGACGGRPQTELSAANPTATPTAAPTSTPYVPPLDPGTPAGAESFNGDVEQPEKQPDTDPPYVDAKWTPTDVRRDKVYKGIVEVEAYDPSEIASVRFLFDGELRPMTYVRNGSGRRWVYELGEKDIPGGQFYEGAVIVRDGAGNYGRQEVDLGYVREFENITENSEWNIVANYTVWDPNHWGLPISVTPILGKYNSSDPLVMAKHIDWANGYGINGFMVDWYGSNEVPDKNTKRLFNHTLSSTIDISIMFDSAQPVMGDPPWDVDNNFIRNRIINQCIYVAETYFNDPKYWRINESPVIYLWPYPGFVGDFEGLVATLREKLRNLGFNPYIISDSMGFGGGYFNPPQDRKIRPLDGITIWVNYDNKGNPPDLEERVDNYYELWSRTLRSYNVNFIPSALPGFHRPANPDMAILERSPERFKRQLERAKKYADPEIKTIFITTFNDPHETGIEPSKEYGFRDLEMIKEVFYS